MRGYIAIWWHYKQKKDKCDVLNKLQEEYQVPKKNCRYNECKDTSLQLPIAKSCLKNRTV